jgi:hypothetical protein
MSLCRFLPLFLASICAAADPGSAAPELHGIIYTQQGHRFALVSAAGDYSGWVATGATIGGWTVERFMADDDALLLVRDGRQVTVRLRTGGVREGSFNQPTPATVADADDLLHKMKFEAFWDQIASEQKKGIVAAMRQQAAPEFAKAGLPPAEIDALLDKMGDAVVSGMQSDAMRADFARIYSEVYSQEELRGMANFYDTAAGQAWNAKQPLVQQKLMQAMMPRVMQGMPAAQKLAADYLRQRAASPAPATPTPNQ